MCAIDFQGPAYGYLLKNGKKRRGCFCDPLCARYYVHNSNEMHKNIIVTHCIQDGASYLLANPCVLSIFGGVQSHAQWKSEQISWQEPAIPMPATVCVLSQATFSTIRKPSRKLGASLF